MTRRILIAILCCASTLAAQQQPQSVASSPNMITLDEAVQEALSKNLDLAVQRYDISVAEARQIQARLRPNPVLTVSGDHLDLLGTHYDTINNAVRTSIASALTSFWSVPASGRNAWRWELSSDRLQSWEYRTRCARLSLKFRALLWMCC
jgi:outer membrane protein TolC